MYCPVSSGDTVYLECWLGVRCVGRKVTIDFSELYHIPVAKGKHLHRVKMSPWMPLINLGSFFKTFFARGGSKVSSRVTLLFGGGNSNNNRHLYSPKNPFIVGWALFGARKITLHEEDTPRSRAGYFPFACVPPCSCPSPVLQSRLGLAVQSPRMPGQKLFRKLG